MVGNVGAIEVYCKQGVAPVAKIIKTVINFTIGMREMRQEGSAECSEMIGKITNEEAMNTINAERYYL